MSITKIRTEQLRGLMNQYAPIIRTVTPDTAIPSSTVIVTLKGEFFYPDTSFDFIGHIVNSVVFVSTSEVIVSVTTSSSELVESNIVVNNGIESIKEFAFISTSGQVTTPLAADFNNITGNVDITDGNVRSASPTTTGTARWDRLVIPDENWTIQWILRDSGYNAGSGSDELSFYNENGSSLGYTITFQYLTDGRVRCNFRISGNNFYLETFMIKNDSFGLRKTPDGKLQFLRNGTVTKTNENLFDVGFRFNFKVGTSDFENIKFIK